MRAEARALEIEVPLDVLRCLVLTQCGRQRNRAISRITSREVLPFGTDSGGTLILYMEHDFKFHVCNDIPQECLTLVPGTYPAGYVKPEEGVQEREPIAC